MARKIFQRGGIPHSIGCRRWDLHYHPRPQSGPHFLYQPSSITVETRMNQSTPSWKRRHRSRCHLANRFSLLQVRFALFRTTQQATASLKSLISKRAACSILLCHLSNTCISFTVNPNPSASVLC